MSLLLFTILMEWQEQLEFIWSSDDSSSTEYWNACFTEFSKFCFFSHMCVNFFNTC